MSQQQQQPRPPSPPSASQPDPPPPPLPEKPSPPSTPFDSSRMIGIIKKKALMKELAAVYHADCLAKCQQLLELQKKWDEPYIDVKTLDDFRKEKMRAPKRVKKSRA